MRVSTVLPLLALSLSLAESVMVCYMASWAVNRKGPGMFDVEDVDPNICTHLIYAFARLNTTGEIQVNDPLRDLCDNGGECAYNRFTALKKQNPELKTLLAVGGWGDGSEKYSKMAADPAMRKKFIDSTMALLKEHDFDGMDLDWEYPTMRGGTPEDKDNYVILLGELHDALHAVGMMLTAAVPSSSQKIDAGYDVPGIAQSVDLVNLMTYSLHGSWNDYVHHQSGLYPYYKDTGRNRELNIEFVVNYWIQQGMPSTKIAMGVPTYGHCWTLDDLSQTDYYSPASEPGEPGPWTNSAGIWAYSEICYAQQEEPDKWVIKTAQEMKEPYTYRDALWCCFENHTSVAIKANYAKEHKLAGMMVWTVDYDDFHGYCHDRSFDLIKTMAETFGASTTCNL